MKKLWLNNEAPKCLTRVRTKKIIDFLVSAKVWHENNEEILEIAVYRFNDKQLVKRFFFPKNNQLSEWYCYDCEKDKSDTKTRIKKFRWLDYYTDKITSVMIQNFFNIETNDIITWINEQQDSINRNKVIKKQNARTERNNMYLSLIENSVIPDFADYVKEWIEKNDNIGFKSTRKNGSYKIQCSHCWNTFRYFEHHLSNYDQVVCPHCGRKLITLFASANDYRLDYGMNIGVLCETACGIALRIYHVNRVDYTTEEYERYLFTEKKTYHYKHEGRVAYGFSNYVEKYNSWYETNELLYDSFVLYNNFSKVSDSVLSSAVKDFLTTVNSWNAVVYLHRYHRLKILEYLTKLGYYGIVKDLSSEYGFNANTKLINVTGRNISEVIGIDINKVTALVEKKDITLDLLRLIQCADKYNRKLTTDSVSELLKYCQYDKMLKYCSPKKLVNYLTRHAINEHDYCDYLYQLESLEYDMTDKHLLYPQNFLGSHQELSLMLKLSEKKIYDVQVQTIYEKCHKLCEWSDGTYSILMPKNCAEIIAEGIAQKHCVGNYCERVAKGESIILFLRRSEDLEKPFLTMEIRYDMKKLDIVQCRGMCNQDPPVELRAGIDNFIVNYSKWFRRRSTDGFKSQIIANYYKAVIKDEDGRYLSNFDRNTEYKIGEIATTDVNTDPDAVAVKGLHIASLEFAQKYGDSWKNVTILEVEVNIHDLIIPNAKDQVRTSRFKVIREVPMSEMGEWGERHSLKNKEKRAAEHVA